MIASEKYSSVEFSPNGGGYVAIEKSAAKHKSEEIEAAKILASKGYKVVLKNEAGFTKTPDGFLFSVSFEQRTPQGNSAQNFKKALGHAAEKNANILVAYMKRGKHTRQSIEDGIKKFEKSNSKRFEQIIIVTEQGKVHRHKHNK